MRKKQKKKGVDGAYVIIDVEQYHTPIWIHNPNQYGFIIQ